MSTLQDLTSDPALRGALFALSKEEDKSLELALRNRSTHVATRERLIPILARHTDGLAVWFRTWDEELQLRHF